MFPMLLSRYLLSYRRSGLLESTLATRPHLTQAFPFIPSLGDFSKGRGEPPLPC